MFVFKKNSVLSLKLLTTSTQLKYFNNNIKSDMFQNIQTVF